jgi:Peptidase family M23
MAQISVSKFPYTGPLYGPSHSQPQSRNRETVKGIKRAMIRLQYLSQPLGSETDDFGAELEKALKTWIGEEYGIKYSHYGVGIWEALRQTKLTQGPNRGQYAMDAKALAYVREDALAECYPHPAGASGTYVGQGLHQTAGIPGNWGIDFMAPGGTKVLAVVNAIVTRLSGHDPASGEWSGPGIFGWSISFETPDGRYRFFSTHYGSRKVVLGQHIDVGQVIGIVGRWPGDPGRSHTHLGCASTIGQADAKKKILAISQAKRVAA